MPDFGSLYPFTVPAPLRREGADGAARAGRFEALWRAALGAFAALPVRLMARLSAARPLRFNSVSCMTAVCIASHAASYEVVAGMAMTTDLYRSFALRPRRKNKALSLSVNGDCSSAFSAMRLC
jgi:hypothetical protein